LNCTRLLQVFDAYLDGELDAATGGEIAEHLAGCPACRAHKAEREELRQQVRAQAPYFHAPDTLRQTIRRSLTTTPARVVRGTRTPSWRQACALASVALVVGVLAGYWWAQPLPDNALREQVVASHVASLADPGRLTDVTSPDRHVVKPWFQGKIDFAPVVRDLSGSGYALAGARLDKVAGRQAVAVVYRVRRHVVNLFVWNTSENESEALAVSTVHGFSVAMWAAGGLRFAAAADVDAGELERFARMVQAQ
jgi:anti-sigma factor RsiW